MLNGPLVMQIQNFEQLSARPDIPLSLKARHCR